MLTSWGRSTVAVGKQLLEIAPVAVFEFVWTLHLLKPVKFFGAAFNGEKGSLDRRELLERIFQLGHENRAAASRTGVGDGLSDVFQVNVGSLVFDLHAEQGRLRILREP